MELVGVGGSGGSAPVDVPSNCRERGEMSTGCVHTCVCKLTLMPF